MAENFPNFKEGNRIQVQEAKNTKEIGNQRDIHQDIINMAKFKDNEGILKTVREKTKVTKERNTYKAIAGVSTNLKPEGNGTRLQY